MLISELEKELTQWLKIRWAAADIIQDIPTSDALMRRTKDLIDRYMKNSESLFRSKLSPEQREVLRNLDIWMATMLDVIFAAIPEQGTFLQIVSVLPDAPYVLFEFRIKYHSSQESELRNAVIGVEKTAGISDDVQLIDLLLLSADLQIASQVPPSDRWLNMPDNWRSKHLICPACGTPIYPFPQRNSRYAAECASCGWESTKIYYYPTDFSEREAFMAERKKVLTFQKRQLAFQREAEAVRAQAAHLQTVCKGIPRDPRIRNQYQALFQEISSLFAEMANQIKERS